MNKLILVVPVDRETGPYIIHNFGNGTYLPVSQRGAGLNRDYMGDSEGDVILKLIEGVGTVTVRVFNDPISCHQEVINIMAQRLEKNEGS